MGAGIALRRDYGPDDLRALARRSKDANQSRRLLALAAVLDGHTRAEAAKIGGMDRQTLRDWVHRFNGSGPEGLIDRKAPGQTPKLSADHNAQLAEVVEQGPIPPVHGVVRWRLKDLVGWTLGPASGLADPVIVPTVRTGFPPSPTTTKGAQNSGWA